MNKQIMRITTNDLMGPLFKSGVGFDRLVNDLMDSSTFTSAGYPPYNLTHVTYENSDDIHGRSIAGSNSEETDFYEITMAVAGFKSEEIDITVNDNVLTVEGKQLNQSKSPGFSQVVNYLHKGIAERDFTRKFRLADKVEVHSATMRDGLLIITLVRLVPESVKPKKIKIQ